MIPEIKECIKGEVTFQYYRSSELWYVTENNFMFPVPVEDIGDATFLNRDRAMMFMRWIRKHIENLTKDAKNQEAGE